MISFSIAFKISSALKASNLEIRLILISVKLNISSLVTSLKSLLLNGVKPLSMVSNTDSKVVHSSISLYIFSSINIFSKEEACHFSFNSAKRMLSSCFNNALVWFVLSTKISFTLIKYGLSFLMTQVFGETDTSQSVKAYKASMVTSGEIPGAKCTIISTFLAVLSSIFLILILPLSLADIILSIKLPVVVEKGTSVMAKVFLSFSIILARTRTLPPRWPSL